MAITANFRPAQHVYQSTYEPFPFQDIAPIAMRMQQEYTAGIGAAGELESFVSGLPVASADSERAVGKMEEAKEQVRGILGKTPDARSPEFHMNLRKVESDIKGDPFWKVTAANATKEQEWKKAISDENLTDANRWQLEKEFARYQQLGSEEYGLLSDATAPEYVDYQNRLEDLAGGFLKEGWQESLETDEFKRSGGQKGVDPNKVASVLGLQILNGKIVMGTGIPQWFYNSEDGAQLKRDAEYLYDNMKAQDPESEVTQDQVEDSLYYDTAARLIEKHSGFVTETGAGPGAGAEDYAGLNFFTYMTELSSLKGTAQAKRAADSYKKSNSMAIWEKVKDMPGFNITTGMVNDFIAEIRDAGYTDDEIRERIDGFKYGLAGTISSIPLAGSSSLGPGAGLALANAMTAPLEYGLQDVAPNLSSLSKGERNTMFRIIEEKGLQNEFAAEGLSQKIWKAMQSETLKYYEQGTWIDVGLNISSESKAPKHVKDTTERLFGIGADKGKVTVGSQGNVPGLISQYIIIDPETGIPGKIQDLDLPKGEEVTVEYKGTLDPRNPYGPQTLAVHIDGKDYYVVGQNPTTDAIDASNLNSYQFSYDGVGIEFNTGYPDEQGQPLMAIPSYNFNTKQYELEFSDGNIYRADDSIEDAYIKFLTPSDPENIKPAE